MTDVFKAMAGRRAKRLSHFQPETVWLAPLNLGLHPSRATPQLHKRKMQWHREKAALTYLLQWTALLPPRWHAGSLTLICSKRRRCSRIFLVVSGRSCSLSIHDISQQSPRSRYFTRPATNRSTGFESYNETPCWLATLPSQRPARRAEPQRLRRTRGKSEL